MRSSFDEKAPAQVDCSNNNECRRSNFLFRLSFILTCLPEMLLIFGRVCFSSALPPIPGSPEARVFGLFCLWRAGCANGNM